MPTPTYDTVSGIKAYLKDGLAGLTRLAKHRNEAYYVRKERLLEWVVLGRFRFDTCGNCMPITKGAPRDVYRFNHHYHQLMREAIDRGIPYRLPEVMSKEEALQFTASMTSTMDALPPLDDTCPRCGKGWTLDNVQDVEWALRCWPVALPHAWHTRCREYAVHEEVRAEFQNAFTNAGLPANLAAVPNQYGSDRYNGPWFLASTHLGTFQVGWRKRVIDLDWSRIEKVRDVVESAALFTDQNVTKSSTNIHCWGYDVLTTYLKQIEDTLRP